MGIASLVLGIISLVLGWIPFICFIAFTLAVIGLILGIVDTVKKNKAGIPMNKTVMSIIGLIISAIAIPVIVFSSFFTIIIIASMENTVPSHEINKKYNIIDEYDYDEWHNRYYNSISYKEML